MQFGEEQAHLNLLAVEPEHRRRAIGRGLIEWLEESCRVAGIVRVELECRASELGTVRFYRALGFEICAESPNYYCGKESALRLQKSLSVLSFAH